MSCAVPGMKRSSFGNWRSIFIWPWPLEPLPPVLLPRRRFNQEIGPPLEEPSMLKPPMRVSFISSEADMQTIMASHASRRAASAGRIGLK
jgi:hypothetical protein